MEKDFFSELSDEELTELAKTDSAASAELMSRISPYIKSLSKKFNAQISEDLFQEGMLGALSAIDSFDSSRASAKAFLLTCAKNKMLSALKSNIPFASSEDITDTLAETENEHSYSDSTDELYDLIERCLTKRERETVTYYLMGLSYKEIAAEMRVSEKSVDNSMQRARKKLREGFGK
ncbi:MAG: sigma-70 family RNA polymerase sigma factor [Ruminococcus sp.]|nr:sigma-70 family RNA polymerase sigma factor [Ruminococcus sp.]